MKPRPRHDTSGEFPDLLPRDVLCGGELLLFRNPHGEPFGERDAWCLTEEWFALDDIRPAYASLLEKESRLGAKQPFAWNEDFGYLSPFPEHCGTGLLIRADLHLEGLHMIGDVPPVLNALKAVRFGAEGVNMDGLQNAAHIFDVYTNASLGISEEDLMAHAERIFSQLVDQEINARLRLVRELPRTFEDAVARSLAILQNCRLLSPWELLDIISPIRLAAVMGFLDGITRAEADAILRKQLSARDDLPDSADGDRMRDERDAAIADDANKRFARIRWNSRAKEYLS